MTKVIWIVALAGMMAVIAGPNVLGQHAPDEMQTIHPDELVAKRAELANDRESLVKQAKSICEDINAWNTDFANRDLSDSRVQAAQRSQELIDDEMNAFRLDADRYFRGEIEVLKIDIDMDLATIRRLKFETRAEDFEEWEKLSEKAKADLENQALDALITVGLTGAQALNAVATILSWGVEDPKLSILVAELQLTTASIYNNVARRVAASRIDQLMAMTEDQLKALRVLDVRLKNLVKQRREFKEALASSEINTKIKAVLLAEKLETEDAR